MLTEEDFKEAEDFARYVGGAVLSLTTSVWRQWNAAVDLGPGEPLVFVQRHDDGWSAKIDTRGDTIGPMGDLQELARAVLSIAGVGPVHIVKDGKVDRAALAALTGGVLDEEVDSPRIAVALLPNGHRVVVRGGNGDPQVEIVEAFSLRVLAAIELPAAGDHRPLRDWIKASVKALGGGP